MYYGGVFYNAMIFYTLVLFYILNASLLTLHEFETASWQSVNLFKLPKNFLGFLVLHLPLLVLMSYGLVGLYQNASFGYTISLFLALGGLMMFGMSYFKTGFNLKNLHTILLFVGGVSLIQIALTVLLK